MAPFRACAPSARVVDAPATIRPLAAPRTAGLALRSSPAWMTPPVARSVPWRRMRSGTRIKGAADCTNAAQTFSLSVAVGSESFARWAVRSSPIFVGFPANVASSA